MRGPHSGPSGIILIDKPPGVTSHDSVNVVRRALGARRVGHAGTLDPMATGLLVMGVGRATRLLRFLGDLTKTYAGTGVLGVETSTLDADGQVVRETPVAVGEEEVRAAMTAFRGEIEQVPPAFSAVKVAGQRMYRAARRGEALEARARRVRVDAFDLIGFRSPRFEFRVECSGGTYVRSLVAGVGDRLGCGAHLTALRRTAIGPFVVAEAQPPDQPRLLPLEWSVEHLPGIRLDAEEARAASFGRVLAPAGLHGPYRVTAPDGHLIGIYRDAGAKALPEIILAPAGSGSEA